MTLALGILLGCNDAKPGGTTARDGRSSDVPEVDVEVPGWPECGLLESPVGFDSLYPAWVACQERTPDTVAIAAGLAYAESQAGVGCPAWVTNGPVETITGDCTAAGGAVYSGAAYQWFDEEQFTFMADEFVFEYAAEQYSFSADGVWRTGPVAEGASLWATGTTSTGISTADAASGVSHGGREDDGGFVCARGVCTESGRVRLEGLWSDVAGTEVSGDFCYAGASHGSEWPFSSDGDGVIRLVGSTQVEFRRSGGEWWASLDGGDWATFTP